MSNLPFESAKTEVFTKKPSKTDPNLGQDPNNRPIKESLDYGIINIDKPKGPTSHQVSDFVQKILQINKSGHSGTLDPAVTGVLPVAIGRATRIVQALLPAGKEYVGIMHIHKEIPEKELIDMFKKFTGKIKQKPPIKSAVKRVERTREIYYLEMLEMDGKEVLFRVGCEAGTYIRKLCHDIGQSLKIGAHMSELRRTKAGPFNESTLFTLQDLADAYHYYKNENNEKYLRKIIQPIENAVKHLPKIWVNDAAIPSLCHGIDLKIPGISKLTDNIKKNDLVAIMTLKNELVALGIAQTDSVYLIKKDKGIALKTEKVFMLPELYKTKT